MNIYEGSITAKELCTTIIYRAMNICEGSVTTKIILASVAYFFVTAYREITLIMFTLFTISAHLILSGQARPILVHKPVHGWSMPPTQDKDLQLRSKQILFKSVCSGSTEPSSMCHVLTHNHTYSPTPLHPKILTFCLAAHLFTLITFFDICCITERMSLSVRDV